MSRPCTGLKSAVAVCTGDSRMGGRRQMGCVRTGRKRCGSVAMAAGAVHGCAANPDSGRFVGRRAGTAVGDLDCTVTVTGSTGIGAPPLTGGYIDNIGSGGTLAVIGVGSGAAAGVAVCACCQRKDGMFRVTANSIRMYSTVRLTCAVGCTVTAAAAVTCYGRVGFGFLVTGTAVRRSTRRIGSGRS